MKLKEILKKCTFEMEIINNKNFEVNGISLDSREIKKNFIFGAVKGNFHNGEDFIKDLLTLKNLVILISSKSSLKIDCSKYPNIVLIKVEDVGLISYQISSIIYSNSIKKKFAVTGTNGKTSVASYVYQIWEKQNLKAASVGTLGTQFKRKKIFFSNLTTPLAIDNHKILNKLSKLGCERVIFEASSIGLDQERLYSLKFDVIAFTNLSKDHLDYHSNMKNYKLSKSKLFKIHAKKNTLAVINSDSKFSPYFKKVCNECKIKVFDFGEKASFLRINKIIRSKNNFEVTISLKNKNFKIKIETHSRFEIYNRICSLIMVFNDRLSRKHFGVINELKSPAGRLEKIYDKHKIKVFIDYAHTPEALSKVLSSLKEITKGKLHLVFGCGGNRDTGKRLLMTKEAIKYADSVVITNDNPRFENPKKIISDMITGLKKSEMNKIIIISDRYKAIKKAIKSLSQFDLLLIAGKGHENYQIIKDKKNKFSDRLVAKKFLLEK